MKYDDIINLSRPKSIYPKRDINKRAGQFSAFAALIGYEDLINEINRKTVKKKELDEDKKIILDNRIKYIKDNPDLEVVIKYFLKDKKKDGGIYIEVDGYIKKIDDVDKKIIMMDGNVIRVDDIFDIKIKRTL